MQLGAVIKIALHKSTATTWYLWLFFCKILEQSTSDWLTITLLHQKHIQQNLSSVVGILSPCLKFKGRQSILKQIFRGLATMCQLVSPLLKWGSLKMWTKNLGSLAFAGLQYSHSFMVQYIWHSRNCRQSCSFNPQIICDSVHRYYMTRRRTSQARSVQVSTIQTICKICH